MQPYLMVLLQETVSRFYIVWQSMDKQKPARFPAGCKTCRRKPAALLGMADGVVCGAWCFMPWVVDNR